MLKTLFAKIALLLGLGGVAILGTQVSVPSAVNQGQYLVSSTTGNWVASSTNRINAGAYLATTTSATSTFLGGITVSGGLQLTNMTGGTNCVQFDANGNLTQASASCGTGAGGGTYPFTPSNSYGFPSSATTTLVQLTGGLTASSTTGYIVFDNATTTNATTTTLQVSGTASTTELIVSNGILANLGTAARVAYGFLGFPSTGLQNVGGSNVSVLIGGTNRVSISSTGIVNNGTVGYNGIAGSAASPTYQFQGGAGNGMFYATAPVRTGIASALKEIGSFTNAGAGASFGIGTTSPSRTFSDVGDAIITGNLILDNLTATGTATSTFNGAATTSKGWFNNDGAVTSSATVNVCTTSGECDFTDIQSALNSLQGPLGLGGKVHVACGDYTITSPLIIMASSTVLEGEGLCTRIKFDGSTVPKGLGVSTSTLEDIYLRDFFVYQTNATPLGIGIDASNTPLLYADNIKVMNAATGTSFQDSVNRTFYQNWTNIDLRDNRNCVDIGGGFGITGGSNPTVQHTMTNMRCDLINGLSGFGIYIDSSNVNGTQNWLFNSPDIEQQGSPAGETGIYIKNGFDLTFINAFVENEGTGIKIDNPSARNAFIGGEVLLNTTNLVDNGIDTAFTNSQVGSTLYNHISPFVIQDQGNSRAAIIEQNNRTFAATVLDYNKFSLLNTTDTANLFNFSNAGTGKTIIATTSKNVFVLDNNLFGGFGTTSPLARLTISATSSLSNLPFFLIATSSASATSTAVVVNSNGQMGIGTTTPSNPFGLSVSGQIYSTGTSTFGGLVDLGILNCNGANTLDTDASGNVVCGADVSAAGGSSGLATTTADYIIATTTAGLAYSLYTPTNTIISTNASADVVLRATLAHATSTIGNKGADIYVKAGIYYLNATTTLFGQGIDSDANTFTLHGAGADLTRFVVNGNSDGFALTNRVRVNFSNFSMFVTGSANAITGKSGSSGFQSVWNSHFENLYINSTSTTASGVGFLFGNDYRNNYTNIQFYGLARCIRSYSEGNGLQNGDSIYSNIMCSTIGNTLSTTTAYDFDGTANSSANQVNDNTFIDVNAFADKGSKTAWRFKHALWMNIETTNPEGFSTTTEIYNNSSNNTMRIQYAIGSTTPSVYFYADSNSSANVFSCQYIDSYNAAHTLFVDRNTDDNNPNILQGYSGSTCDMRGSGTFAFSTTTASITRDLDLNGVSFLQQTKVLGDRIALNFASGDTQYIKSDGFGINLINNSNTGLTVNSSGNVGIHNQSPATTLDVSGNGVISSNGWVTSTTGGWWLDSFNSFNVGYYRDASGNSFLRTNGLPRLTILNGGNIGIGTTSPLAILTVSATSSLSNINLFQVVSNKTATTTAFVIDSSGTSTFNGIAKNSNGDVLGIPATYIVSTSSLNGNFTNLQTAINNLPAAGGKIFVRAGTYTLTATTSIKVSNTVIEGEGPATQFNFNGAVAYSAFDMNATGLTDIRLANFYVHNTNASNMGIGINASNTPILLVENIKIDKTATATLAYDTVDQTLYQTWRNLDLRDNTTCFEVNGIGAHVSNRNSVYDVRCAPTSGNGGTGLFVDAVSANGAQSWIFHGFDVEPTGAATAITGINLNTAVDTVLIGPYVEGVATGLKIGSNSQRTTIIGGQFVSNTTNVTDSGKLTNYLGADVGSAGYTKFSTGTFIQDIGSTDAGKTNFFVLGNTNFAKSALDDVKFEMENTTDTSNLLNLQNPGSGYTLIATSSRGAPYYLTALGAVGIATSAPWALLSVQATSSLSNIPLFAVASTSASATTTTFTVDSTGRIGLGTTTPSKPYSVSGMGRLYWTGLTKSGGSQTSDICGTATDGGDFNADTSVCIVSDLRAKNVEGPFTNSLSEISQIEPILYHYKPEFNGPDFQSNPNYNDQKLGLGAQDLQKIDPRLVEVYTADGCNSAFCFKQGEAHAPDLYALTTLALGGVKELNAKLDGLTLPKIPEQKRAEDTWQWFVIALLAFGVVYQQIQIGNLKKK